MTDNGSCYVFHAFRGLCRQLGLRHRYTRPYRPQTNGKAERFIQASLRECAYRFSYRISRHRMSRLRPWLDFYDHHRMQQSLAGQTPPTNNVMRLHTWAGHWRCRKAWFRPSP